VEWKTWLPQLDPLRHLVRKLTKDREALVKLRRLGTLKGEKSEFLMDVSPSLVSANETDSIKGEAFVY